MIEYLLAGLMSLAKSEGKMDTRKRAALKGKMEQSTRREAYAGFSEEREREKRSRVGQEHLAIKQSLFAMRWHQMAPSPLHTEYSVLLQEEKGMSV